MALGDRRKKKREMQTSGGGWLPQSIKVAVGETSEFRGTVDNSSDETQEWFGFSGCWEHKPGKPIATQTLWGWPEVDFGCWRLSVYHLNI